MITINIQAVPNQKFSFDIEGVSIEVELKTTSYTVATVSINGVVISSGVRVMPYRPMMPYEYLTQGFGNLFFITDNGDLPIYSEFGVTQTLVYLTPDEIADLPNAY